MVTPYRHIVGWREEWSLLLGIAAVAGTALHSLVLTSAASTGEAAPWSDETTIGMHASEVSVAPGAAERWPVHATARIANYAAVSGDTPEAAAAPPPAEPRTEREHYERFLALAAEGNGALEGVAPAILCGTGPDCEKVACLRALHGAGSPARREHFLFALEELHGPSVLGNVSVAEFALRFLADAARDDAGAWDILRDAVWDHDRGMSPALRRRAAALLADTADAEQLRRLSLDLQTEADDDVIESARAALGRAGSPPYLGVNTHSSLAERRLERTDEE